MQPNTRRVIAYKGNIIRRLKDLDPRLATDLDSFLSNKLPWYYIKNEADGESTDTTTVFIYEEIGGSFGISADEFVKDLETITTPNINVRINSPGGSVFDSIAIRNALVRHQSKVITTVDALAASGASIIALGGDEIEMMPGSQMMIHDALGEEMGNAKQFREMADFLDKQSDNIAAIYATKAGGEIQEWRNRMLAETWLFDVEAVEMGLADRIYATPTAQPETEPDEDEPEQGEPEPEESTEDDEIDDEESEDDELEDIAALMRKRHPLNKFKYAGRRKAPAPLSNSNGIDPHALADAFRSIRIEGL